MFIIGACFGVAGMAAWLFGNDALTALFTLVGLAAMIAGYIRSRTR